jgi:hypothetical protein
MTILKSYFKNGSLEVRKTVQLCDDMVFSR